MTDADLTAIYNEANGIAEGKRPIITTARIFAAMRLVAAKERERCAKVLAEHPGHIPSNRWNVSSALGSCEQKIREMK